MKRFYVLIAAIAMVVFVMAPAFAAELTVGGYYRMQVVSDTIGGAPAKDKDSVNVIDNRFRAKVTYDVNESLSLVYYGEVDAPFGESSKGGIGGGGKVGADGVNIETKNVYASFKIPGTPLSAITGIQGFGGRFDSALVNDDMAGITLKAGLKPLTLTGGYFVWDEGERDKSDDKDLYALLADFNLSDSFTLSVDGYNLKDRANDTDIYFVGPKIELKTGSFGLKGWFLYETGNVEFEGADDIDISSYAASVKATATFGGFNVGARVLYYSPDDDATDDGKFYGGGGAFEFHDDNLMIFLTDIYYNNTAGGRHALTDAAYAGYGLIGGALSCGANLGGGVYMKAGAGYFSAIEDEANDDPATKKKDKDLGFEIAGQLGVKVAEKVDLSVRGAYAMIGDFYDNGTDPDDMYKFAFMTNISY